MTAPTKRPERFAETAIDDEIVLMRLDNGDFFSLSETAAAVWRLIDGKRDRSALVSALGETFEGDQSMIANDVDELLVRLRASGFVE
jgi:pyrroloquinoline quinone biosynthesis protein D